MAPPAFLVVLLSACLMVSSASAAALQSPADESGGVGPLRALLQASTECSRTVANCEACRFQVYSGSVTRAICTRCATGYVVKASGRGCWCAPGYYKSGSSCLPCGNAAYCPGAKSTDAAGRYTCGTNKVTQSQYGRSDRDCLVQPGYGWAPGNGATVCPVGFYNPGYNTRRCSSCPGGMTCPEGSLSSQSCVAPPGYYYQRGRAVACAQGYYKATAENRNCDACPDGFTTQFGTVAATSPSQCSYVKPGYQAVAGQQAVLGTVDAVATLCAANTYRSNEVSYDDAAGTMCTPCPDGMETHPDEPAGATSRDNCLAPPGYGYFNSPMRAEPCPLGSYNYGWNREPCSSCGIGTMTTANNASESENDCMLPAGHGSEWVTVAGKVVLRGFPCLVNTYGDTTETFGLYDKECNKCPQNSVTVGTGSQEITDCVPIPGYGYGADGYYKCFFGTWSAGGTNSECDICSDNYNTADGPNGTVAVLGADSADDCVFAAGYTSDGNGGGPVACAQGTYKTLLGTSSCLTCPANTNTSTEQANTLRSDCDMCNPGYGAASIDPQNPSCALCGSGTYSAGGVKGGEACTACPKPDGYTGNMVSRQGITDQASCFTEFAVDDVVGVVIPMNETVFNVTSDVTKAACQALCAGSADCQYFAWYEATEEAPSNCYLRRGGVAAADVTDNSGSYIAFPTRPAQGGSAIYVAYNAHETDWDSTGAPISGDYTSFALAAAACGADLEACAGVKSSAGSWRIFGTTTAIGTVFKAKVTGAALVDP